MNTRDFAQWIRTRLRQKGWTQRELLERSGLSHRTLTQVLRGNHDCKWSTMQALLHALDADVAIVPKDLPPLSGALFGEVHKSSSVRTKVTEYLEDAQLVVP